MIDLMDIGKLKYLVAINVNTKYLFAEIINEVISESEFSQGSLKSTVSYLRAFNRIIEKGANITHLIGDGEPAFKSDVAWESFYNSRGIDFKTVPRQVMGNYPDFMKKEQKQVKTADPLHTSLGIVDRVIRTIRDMAYNMNIGIITPEVMDEIVKQYNNAPHKGLSKWAGFSVTPMMVNNDPDLENFIVRRILQANWEIKNSVGFNINDGENVKVHNTTDSKMKRRSVIQPGLFQVIGKENGLYKVQGRVNGKNRIQLLPRYLIEPII